MELKSGPFTAWQKQELRSCGSICGSISASLKKTEFLLKIPEPEPELNEWGCS